VRQYSSNKNDKNKEKDSNWPTTMLIKIPLLSFNKVTYNNAMLFRYELDQHAGSPV